jgi:hypothetical protein
MLNKLKQKQKKTGHTHSKNSMTIFSRVGSMLNAIQSIVQWSNRSGPSHYIINTASVTSRSVTVQGILCWVRQAFICIMQSTTMVRGILSPQRGMSSVCGWSVMEGCHKYTEQAAVDGWHRVVCKLGSLARGVTTPHRINRAFYEMPKCYRMLAPYTLCIIPRPGFHTVQQLSNQHVPDGWIYLW